MRHASTHVGKTLIEKEIVKNVTSVQTNLVSLVLLSRHWLYVSCLDWTWKLQWTFILSVYNSDLYSTVQLLLRSPNYSLRTTFGQDVNGVLSSLLILLVFFFFNPNLQKSVINVTVVLTLPLAIRTLCLPKMVWFFFFCPFVWLVFCLL